MSSVSPYAIYVQLAALEQLWTKGKKDLSASQKLLSLGLMGVELSARLVDNLLADQRAASRTERKIHFTLQGIAKQLRLLATLQKHSRVPRAENPPKSIPFSNLVNLQHLPKGYESLLAEIELAYNDLEIALQGALGLRDFVPHAKAGFFQSGIDFDYEKAVDPESLSTLRPVNPFGPEDELFMTVHQVCECWFEITSLNFEQMERCIQVNNMEQATQLLENNAEIFAYLGHHNLILEYMVMADYHPLRVALRGASGGQTQRIRTLYGQSKSLFGHYEAQLALNGKNLIAILDQPAAFVHDYQFLDALSSWEREFVGFFFLHYKLLGKVISTASIGSIGVEVNQLVSRFTAPLFPSLDQARFDLVIQTNYRYSNIAGQVLKEMEEPPKPVNPAKLPTKVMADRIDAYFAAINELDEQSWLNLMDENIGYIEDPIGTRVYQGKSELSAFFKSFKKTFLSVNIQVQKLDLQEAKAIAHWEAYGESYNHKWVRFKGIEHFYFDSAGKMLAIEVDWDPREVEHQLK
jgi:hypothetical protein